MIDIKQQSIAKRNLSYQIRPFYSKAEALCGTSHLELGGMERKEVFSQNVPSWLEASPSLWKLCLDWGLPSKQVFI